MYMRTSSSTVKSIVAPVVKKKVALKGLRFFVVM